MENDASRKSFDRNSCEKKPLSLGQRYFNIGSFTLNKSWIVLRMGLPTTDIKGKEMKKLNNLSELMRPISSTLKLAYRGHVNTCRKKVVRRYFRLLHRSLLIEEDGVGVGNDDDDDDDVDIDSAIFLRSDERLRLCIQ